MVTGDKGARWRRYISKTCATCGVVFETRSDKAKRTECNHCTHTIKPVLTEPTPAELAGGYRLIPLTQGQFATVDAGDYRWLMQWKWQARWDDHTDSYYAIRCTPTVDGKQGSIGMHRQIKDAPEGVLVDHEDHDTLNNRRTNLRFANHHQNNQNRQMNRNNSSGFRGVRRYDYYGKTPKYVARIHIDGKLTHLGYFDTAEAASEVFEAKAREIRGEFYRPA